MELNIKNRDRFAFKSKTRDFIGLLTPLPVYFPQISQIFNDAWKNAYLTWQSLSILHV